MKITSREQVLYSFIEKLEAEKKELLEALKGLHAEMRYVLRSINADKVHYDGDEFHERLGAATDAITRATKGEKA